MSTRRAEAMRAREFVEAELGLFLRHLSRRSADDILASLHTWAEAVRIRERDRAIGRIGNPDARTREVMDDLSRVLAKKILTDITSSIRASAEEGDLAGAEALAKAVTHGEKIRRPPEP
jgi:glutamyl-tRNA reductase